MENKTKKELTENKVAVQKMSTVKATKLNSKHIELSGQKYTREQLLSAMDDVAFCFIHTGPGCSSHNDTTKPALTGRDIKIALDQGFITKADLTSQQYKAIQKIRP